MITRKENPSFVGRRQQHMDFCARTVMEFTPAAETEEAGLVLIQSDQYNLRAVLTKKKDGVVLRLVKCYDGQEEVLAEEVYAAGRIYLQAEAKRSEEHTSELQSRPHLVCRLLLEKYKQ